MMYKECVGTQYCRQVSILLLQFKTALRIFLNYQNLNWLKVDSVRSGPADQFFTAGEEAPLLDIKNCGIC